MIELPTFDNVLVTGNQTIQQNLQVNLDATVQDLNVTGSETILGHLQVSGTASIGGNVFVGGTAGAAQRISSSNQPTVPGGGSSTQSVLFYPTGAANQPGVQLKGTDGLDYVLFVVVIGGVPSLGIQRA